MTTNLIFGGHWNNCVLNEGWIVLSEDACNIRNKLPFEDNSIDCIFTEHVIEHVEKQEAINFIKESYRILKKNGIFRIVFPSRDTISSLEETKRYNLYNGHGHKHIWSIKEMYNTLEDIGFISFICSIGIGKNLKYCQERFCRGNYKGYIKSEDRAMGFIFDDESSFLEGIK